MFEPKKVHPQIQRSLYLIPFLRGRPCLPNGLKQTCSPWKKAKVLQARASRPLLQERMSKPDGSRLSLFDCPLMNSPMPLRLIVVFRNLLHQTSKNGKIRTCLDRQMYPANRIHDYYCFLDLLKSKENLKNFVYSDN